MELNSRFIPELMAKATEINREMATMDADARLQFAYSIFGDGLIATTSFGRDAALLLHHLHRLKIPIRVFFIDTGFHFPETLAYSDILTKEYQLRLEKVASADPNRRQYATSHRGELTISDIDACCAMNKVAVQRAFLELPNVMAFCSGLRRDQSAHRKELPFAMVQRDRIKIAPFVDWPQSDVDLYLKLWEVTEHPLAREGYSSIGCSPLTCTRKPLPGENSRSGRWAGDAKTECGLHTDLES